jgi:hypothetical protein
MRMSKLTAPVAILLALALTPALTGCAGNPLEQIVEGATGGEVDLGGAGVPDGYPTDAVPLTDGEIVNGMGLGSGDGQVWNVTIKVAGLETIDSIKAQLEGAGLAPNESGLGGVTEQGAAAFYESDAYGVLVVITPDGNNGFVANYTVTQK